MRVIIVPNWLLISRSNGIDRIIVAIIGEICVKSRDMIHFGGRISRWGNQLCPSRNETSSNNDQQCANKCLYESSDIIALAQISRLDLIQLGFCFCR